MTIKELVSELCKAEGLKDQVSVSNMREVVALVSDRIHATANQPGSVGAALALNGKRRAKRAKGKEKK